jgi:hypothetical protein
MEATDSTVNVQLINSIIQVIQALSVKEQSLLFDKLMGNFSGLSTSEIVRLAEQGGSFDFWRDEPNHYSIDDGEPVKW